MTSFCRLHGAASTNGADDGDDHDDDDDDDDDGDADGVTLDDEFVVTRDVGQA